jgi:hypothetical protein
MSIFISEEHQSGFFSFPIFWYLNLASFSKKLAKLVECTLEKQKKSHFVFEKNDNFILGKKKFNHTNLKKKWKRREDNISLNWNAN